MSSTRPAVIAIQLKIAQLPRTHYCVSTPSLVTAAQRCNARPSLHATKLQTSLLRLGLFFWLPASLAFWYQSHQVWSSFLICTFALSPSLPFFLYFGRTAFAFLYVHSLSSPFSDGSRSFSYTCSPRLTQQFINAFQPRTSGRTWAGPPFLFLRRRRGSSGHFSRFNHRNSTSRFAARCFLSGHGTFATSAID